jgi:putative SOS response-associated peptidase YedK
MCGRFTRTTPLHEVATLFRCPAPPPETPTHFNIAPTQPVAVVRIV